MRDRPHASRPSRTRNLTRPWRSDRIVAMTAAMVRTVRVSLKGSATTEYGLHVSYALAVMVTLLYTSSAHAGVVAATPSNYRSLLGSLRPGDTLLLQAGDYAGLHLNRINGTAGAP